MAKKIVEIEEPKVRPGYKTTEFWLSTVATVCGILMASGVIVEGSQAATIVGGILAALSTIGYSAARAKDKAAAEK